MKREFTKTIVVVVVLVLLIGMLSACQSSPDSNTNTSSKTTSDPVEDNDNASNEQVPDTSKAVKLKAYFFGDPAQNEEEGLAQINDYLKDKINASIEFAWISWGDWRNKVPIILASGEPFDLIYTSNWAFYQSEGAKGAFYPIDDLLPTYAPTVYKNIPKEAWEQAKINGKIYMIPKVSREFTHHGALIRGDLRKKYNVPEIKNMKDFGVYLDAIKKNVPDLIPYNEKSAATLFYVFLYENDWGRPATFANGDQGVISYDIINGGEAFDVTLTPEYEEFVKMTRSWYEKGYWSRNILSNQMRAYDALINGQSAAAILNLSNANNAYVSVLNNGYDWELEYFSMEDGTSIERVAYINNGTAIYRNSQNPERALMFVELLHTDRDFYDMVIHGVKGVNYDLTEDGKIKVPDGIDPAKAIGWCNTAMGLAHSAFQRDSVNKWEYVIAEEERLDKIAVMPKYASFVMNQEPISAELAAISNVIQTYKYPLDWGVIDPEEGLPVLRQKLKEAGIEKVIEEINRQLDEFNK